MTRWLPVWGVAIVVILAIGTVWLRLSIVRTTYEIDQVNKMIRNTQQDMERLELKVARLRSPRHLETLAKRKFGLNPPHSEQVIHLQETP